MSIRDSDASIRRRLGALLSALCLILLPSPQPLSLSQPRTPSLESIPSSSTAPAGRIIAIGDVHGDMEQLVRSLSHAGLVDAQLRWGGTNTVLVITGDLLDRGERAPEVLDLAMRLSSEASGQVHVLLGNHEVMNLMGDWRYVAPEEYRRFATAQSQALRRERLESYLDYLRTRARRLGLDEPVIDEPARERWLEERPVGFFERRAAFSPSGLYGRWLRGLDAAFIKDQILFVHGGLNEKETFASVQALNDQVRREITEFDRLWSSLAQAGILWPDLTWSEALGLVRDEASFWAALDSLPASRVSPRARQGRPHDRTLGQMRQLLAFEKWAAASPEGPLWYRGMVEQQPGSSNQLTGPTVQRLLERYGAVQIVVGHTPTEDRRIQRRLDGLVFAIDTGMSASYGGPASALEIVDGTFTALYPGAAADVLQDPLDTAYDALHGLTVAEAENFISSAPIVETGRIATGTTKPSRVTLEETGVRHRAAVQRVDTCELSQSEQGVRERVCDSYKYNLAAYEIAKLLGIDTVPPTVEREFEDRRAAFTWWVDDVMTFAEMHEKKLSPPSGQRWNRQQWVIGVFDELIYNTDRNQGNLLVDPEWRIWMIDHTRAFRTAVRPRNPDMLQKMKIEGELLEGLRKLSAAVLERCCAAYLTGDERKALLARRDTILARMGPQAASATEAPR